MSLTTFAAEQNPDSHFFRDAIAANISEVNGGELAQTKSNNPSVQKFAAMIVKDHTAALTTLRALATGKDIEAPTTAVPEQTAKLAALRAQSPDMFDKSYVEWQIGAHKDAIALFKQETTSGDDLEARQFAATTLPTLQAHLDALYAITL
jgi:putative membrane protein